MQNLYIHVGTHKTATTWLQHYFAKNADRLSDFGFYYPSTGRVTQAQHRLGQAIFQRANPKGSLDGVQVWERFRREIALTRHENILISSEEFEWVPQPKVIREFLPDVRIRTIVYLRRQDDYLESLYGQQIRDYHPRLTKTIHQYLNENDLRFLDYDRLIRRWEVASDEVFVRVFDRKFMANGEVGDDFLAAIGIESSAGFENPTAAVIEQKASLGLDALEFVRQCNFLKLSAVTHDQLVARAIALDRIASAGGSAQRQRLLDASDRRELVKNYEKGNRSIAARYPAASGLAMLFAEIEGAATAFSQKRDIDLFEVAFKANSLVKIV